MKITGLKKTIYNVLALDRCSTCVTVLIYETKMVTVNYVFLCAFFCLFVCFKVGDFFGTRRRPTLVPDLEKKKKEKKVLVLVEYNKTFPKKEGKKWGKKSRKM